MRRIFYLSLFLFSYAMVSAQQPGGVSGSVLWLRPENYAPGVGATPSLWTDLSAAGNNFTNSDPDRSPSPNANIYNFNSALTFDGSVFLSNPLPTGFPSGDADRTIFVVANPANATASSSYQWILAYGTRDIYQTMQVGANNKDYAAAFYGFDVSAGDYWATGNNPNGGLVTFILRNNAGTIQGDIYDRSNYLTTALTPPLGATSIDAIIGALTSAPAEAWNGNIGEVIMFPSALSDVQRIQVESYLAFKYGFTLGDNVSPVDYTASDGTTVFWTGSTTFQNNIFGIGTDNGSQLVVSLSNSMNTGSGDGTGQSGKANITIGVATDLLDKQFLMIGNDAGALTEQTIAAGQAPVIAVGSSRLGRNWKVQNTGAVGPLDLFTIDLVGLTVSGGSDPDNYRLMIDNDGDGDYSTGTPDFIKPAGFLGTQLSFDLVNLPNNATFTLITQGSPALLPAIWQGFEVSLQRAKATLIWKTSDEVNVDHYTVEYSTNGVSFTTLGSVKAKNTAGTNTYTLSQDNLPAGIRYYRVKRVDKDGKTDISPVRSVRAGGISSVLLRTNPVTRSTVDLIIDIPQYQEAVIRVISVEGRVLSARNTSLSTGTNNVSTNVSKLAAGTYILQVQMANEVYNKKFVKQ